MSPNPDGTRGPGPFKIASRHACCRPEPLGNREIGSSGHRVLERFRILDPAPRTSGTLSFHSYPQRLCSMRAFRTKRRSIVVYYREICDFSDKKSCCFSVIVSMILLFSYTSPEVPSFLTSLWCDSRSLDFCHEFLIESARRALSRFAIACVARNGLCGGPA